jgi:hypothetical protein
MKNKGFLLFCGVLSFTALFFAQEQSREKLRPHYKRSPATLQKPTPIKAKKKFDLKQVDASRHPIPEAQRGSKIVTGANFDKPTSPEVTPIETASSPIRGLEGLSLASALRALKATDFSPEMGDVIKEVAGMVYFKPANGRSDDSWSQVAYDKNNNRFFPISSILRVQGISQDRRDELLSNGFQEHYYSAPTSIMYVRSSQQTLWTDYKALEAQHLNVSVEVTRSTYQTR